MSTAALRIRRHRLPMIVPTGGSGATYNKATQASVGSTAALIAYVRFAAIRRGGGRSANTGPTQRRARPIDELCIAYGVHKTPSLLLASVLQAASSRVCRTNCRGRSGGFVGFLASLLTGIDQRWRAAVYWSV